MSSSRFSTAMQVFEAFPSLFSDMAAAPTNEAPQIYVRRLLAGETPEDAVSFCAYMLDRRKAVWWAAQCARRLGSPESPAEELALNLAETWIKDPGESSRRAALATGMNGNNALPGVWAALAAGSAGGTFPQGDQPGPPVPPQLCAQSVRAAVLIAVARSPIRERPARINEIVAAGIQLYDSA